MVGECRHVGDGTFEIKIEAVDYCVSEGTRDVGAGFGAEDGPDVCCCADGGGGSAEAAFGVGCSSDGEEDGFPVGGLACGYVLSVGVVSTGGFDGREMGRTRVGDSRIGWSLRWRCSCCLHWRNSKMDWRW